MKCAPAMLWDMIFLIIMSRYTGMANLRRKIPSVIVHSKKRKLRKTFFCPLLLTGTPVDSDFYKTCIWKEINRYKTCKFILKISYKTCILD